VKSEKIWPIIQTYIFTLVVANMRTKNCHFIWTAFACSLIVLQTVHVNKIHVVAELRAYVSSHA